MARPLSDILIDFVARLREAGVRISVAESLDAVQAVSVAGVGPARMREALRASLIKDEADSPIFDRVFAEYFAAPSRSGPQRESSGARVGISGSGRGDGAGVTPPPLSLKAAESASPRPGLDQPDVERIPSKLEADIRRSSSAADSKSSSASTAGREADRSGDKAGSAAEADTKGSRDGAEAIAPERAPFSDYSPVEYEQARDVLAVLQRRLRVRLGRRIRRAKAGRIDLRRTLRASIQRGGALIDLQFRARRPRHIDLVALADISGSVQYASALMIELLAGASDCFRRVHNFVFIDRLATADFEQGHLVTSPVLDRYARSDFGRVLVELTTRHLGLFNSATVLVILGDGRNNRRPARADLLRDLSRRCRATIWLNPEPVERWGIGDSAIEGYRKAIDSLLPCKSLDELAARLALIA